MDNTVSRTRIGGGREYSISLIRCIAFICIVVCHFMQYLGIELANWFNVGVQIFLCISGYLYGQRHIEDDISYYLKQIKKILVPYYIVIIPVIIIRLLFFHEEGFGIIRVIGVLLVY